MSIINTYTKHSTNNKQSRTRRTDTHALHTDTWSDHLVYSLCSVVVNTLL